MRCWKQRGLVDASKFLSLLHSVLLFQATPIPQSYESLYFSHLIFPLCLLPILYPGWLRFFNIFLLPTMTSNCTKLAPLLKNCKTEQNTGQSAVQDCDSWQKGNLWCMTLDFLGFLPMQNFLTTQGSWIPCSEWQSYWADDAKIRIAKAAGTIRIFSREEVYREESQAAEQGFPWILS